MLSNSTSPAIAHGTKQAIFWRCKTSKKGKSKKTISNNIDELTMANRARPKGKKRSKRQIVRIAHEYARR